MRTRQLLLALVAIVLAHPVRCEDVDFKALSSQVFAPFGETVWVNCSTPSPEDTFYESRLQKVDTMKGPNWFATEVLVNDWEISTLYCTSGGRESPTTVMAYALPSKVTIDLQTELKEGEEYTIICTVHEVAPLEFLTINITRGAEVIASKSYEGPHVANKTTVSHSHTFTARRSDDQMIFSCDAVLQLGPDSHTNKSSEIKVLTYTLPEVPVIRVDKWIEAGTPVTAECLVTNGFPPQNVILSLFIDDEELPVTTTNEGIVMVAVLLNDFYLGQKTIKCESHLFTLSKETAENVTFYENPMVSFDLSSDVVVLEEKVTVTCYVNNTHPEAYRLNISVGGEKHIKTSMVTNTLTVSSRTPSILLTCTAYIIGKSSISRSVERTLQVHYPPEFTDSLCPSTMNLTEGETGFSCLADGNPEPTLECSANGHYINDTVKVTRGMSGNYTCHATNERGRVTTSGTVTVQYSGTPWIIIILGVVAAVFAIIAIACIVCYICWKVGRRGIYELLPWSHSQCHQNGNVHPEVAKIDTSV